MKTVDALMRWLFILCFPVLLLSASIGWAANSLWLYEHGFSKYDVSQTTGLAEAELEKAARSLISYFNSDEDYISVTVIKDGQPFELFNQREIVHLKDVKGLIWLDYRLFLWTLAYTLAYAGLFLFWRKDRRGLARSMVGGSGLTLALMAALGLGTLFGFDQLFLQFHLISFANELWLLDPAKDYLIMLVPGGFWYDATLFVVLATTGLAVVLSGVSGGCLWATKRRIS
ncbi:MAG: TIGR01906 family membrane protein [Chloroflexi bacterium]|nr:TIGR01906 family membrane protein [Chloroflexota bacterium]